MVSQAIQGEVGSRPRSTFLSTSRLISIFNLPIVAITGWLLWHSLRWPLIGDATIFHFIASQFWMGAVPYRDIFDVNMPLIYGIHAAIVQFGGMGDGAWRAFDLATAAIMSVSILMLVRPAGLGTAVLGLLVMLAAHLLLGPLAAGQRDYLVAIFAVIAAWTSASAAEDRGHRRIYLLAAGAFAMVAACIKPTALVLFLLPAVIVPALRWRDMIAIAAGAAAVAILVFGTLAALGGMGPFVTMIRELLPRYSSLDTKTVAQILQACVNFGPLAGLAIAVLSGFAQPKTPRVRAMMALAAFGLFHLLAQRKGYYYHVYPLAIAVACWGAWNLASLPVWRGLACLMITVSMLGWYGFQTVNRGDEHPELRAAAAMQTALASHLPRGARVQALDSDRGAFLAMARAGMRQATPHIQWFSLILADDLEREDFLAALKADPPAAMLLTNDFWPAMRDRNLIDAWGAFNTFLRSYYDLNASGHEDYIDWWFYLRCRGAADARDGPALEVCRRERPN
jgi:hypothetical protein